MAEELQSRMEEIRLKSEELEKKHKEMLEDEMEAKKMGAVVEAKQISTSKETSHPYDNVHLDFDVKEEQREHAKNPDYKPKNRRPILGKKQLDEIPPDPRNFLREDGNDAKEGGEQNQNGGSNSERRPPQQNKNRRPQQPRAGYNNSNGADESSGHSRPSRNHQNSRPRQNQSNFNRNSSEESPTTAAQVTSPRKPHPQQLRNERRSAPNPDQQQQQQHPNDGNNRAHSGQPQQQQPNRSRRPNNNGSSNNNNRQPHQQHQPRANGDNNSDRRSNITVQVNDEVRSVKLKTSEKIGTGRVRPPTDANFDESAANEANQSNEGKRNAANSKNPRNRPRNHKPRPKPEPEILQHPILEKIVITKGSVQERLNRSKMLDDKDLSVPKVESEPSTPAIES